MWKDQSKGMCRWQVSMGIYYQAGIKFIMCENLRTVPQVPGQCVDITDVSRALVSADWPDDAPKSNIQFEGAMVGMVCQIRPEY